MFQKKFFEKMKANFLILLCILFILIMVIPYFFKFDLSFITNLSYATLYKKSSISENVYEHKFKSLIEIHEHIRHQIHSLQEEGDCERKKILLCRNVENYAGFGSNVHRYGVCMQVAYGLGRTFFIHQNEYSHFDGIFQWVKPESSKCGYLKQKILAGKLNTCNAQDPSCYLNNGYDLNNTHQVIEFNTLIKRIPYPRHIPGTLPEELRKNLLYLKIEYPWLWFTSQFLSYLLLRPRLKFNEKLSALKEQINFTLPIVGFHIRHGDKLTSGEAKYINENEFVNIARTYCNEYNISKKQIYIATDDLEAINITKNHAPDFQTTSLPHSYLTNGLGSYFQNSFPKEIIESTLVDLYLLTSTSYLVCDISSNICRLAYELKQGMPPFKQDNIFKQVNKEMQFFYCWWGLGFPSSMWISKKPNEDSEYKSEDGKVYKILKYGKDLFTEIETTSNTNVSDLLYLKRITQLESEENGYVYKKDLSKWPGTPTYHFFPTESTNFIN
ncbi:alpha-(1,6)-fucosyltransferase [Hydra vulgaris]|uniref:alpha-(1,6)-fucosyltransferase n=1 Tax=Hydra vulgaris TaxID=6087 RepID=UPI001F5EC656|nr:alpha-(1,6)-fucosyltransferase-like [Hydra vulgaris]